MFAEALLEDVQLPIFSGEAFDRRHTMIVCLSRKRVAGFDSLTIHQHRARTTLSGVATQSGACEKQALTNKMSKRRSRIDGRRDFAVVHT